MEEPGEYTETALGAKAGHPWLILDEDGLHCVPNPS